MKKGEGVSHGFSCHWDTRVTALPALGSGLALSPFGPSLHIHLSLPGPSGCVGSCAHLGSSVTHLLPILSRADTDVTPSHTSCVHQKTPDFLSKYESLPGETSWTFV